VAYFRVQKREPSDRIVRQFSSVHIFTPCFSKIHFNIILPSKRRSSKQSLHLRVFDQVRISLLQSVSDVLLIPSF